MTLEVNLCLGDTERCMPASQFDLTQPWSWRRWSHRKGTSRPLRDKSHLFNLFVFIPGSATGGGAVNVTLAIMFSEDTYTLAPTKSSLWDRGSFGFPRLHNWCYPGTLWFRWFIGHKLFRYVLPSFLGFLHILLSRYLIFLSQRIVSPSVAPHS